MSSALLFAVFFALYVDRLRPIERPFPDASAALHPLLADFRPSPVLDTVWSDFGLVLRILH